MVLGDVGQHQPVVPVSSTLLQPFKGFGETTWRLRCFGCVFGDVSRELRHLADGVQVVGSICFSLGRGRNAVLEPVLRQSRQLCGGEREALDRFEFIEERFECQGKARLLMPENAEQLAGEGVTVFFEALAEFIGIILEGLGRSCGESLLDEVDLDVDIADVSGGSAKFFQDTLRFAGKLVVRRDSGEVGEHGELAFDAAGHGAKAVDGLDAGVGEAEGDCRLELGNVLAEGADRIGGSGGRCHENSNAGLDKNFWAIEPLYKAGEQQYSLRSPAIWSLPTFACFPFLSW